MHEDLARRPVGREGDRQLRQGDRQGAVEDHVQDGRVDLHVVLRRAVVRGDRPREGRWSRSTSAARRARSAASACSRSPRKRSACTAPRSATTRCSPTMLDAGGEYAWRVRGEEHMWTPDAIAKLQHSVRADSVRDLQGVRADHQRPVAPPHDAARAVRVQDRPRQGDPARRGRAGDRDRQALRHRRDVARLDLDRGARDARGGDEPHRRQEQHRRGRRGPGALPQRAEGHPDRRRARRSAT